MLPRADAYGLGTFREDYIKGMSAPKKVDGIALSKPLTPSEAAEQYDTLVRQIREDETPPEYINPDDALVELDTAPTKDSPLDAKPKDELAEFKRSKQVKDSFGDWETLAAIDEIQSMPAVFIAQHEALDKASIKEVFKNFGEVKNKKDGRIVVFPSASAGKIRRHKGFDSNTIIREFKPLFENSIPFISEKEEIKEGHKTHGNIESVEHYVNKFSANGNEYFIRFTVPIIRNNKGADNIHSSAISEVSIYKNGDSTLYPLNTAGSSSPSFIDDKLAKFLNSVNKKDVSKITDEKG